MTLFLNFLALILASCLLVEGKTDRNRKRFSYQLNPFSGFQKENDEKPSKELQIDYKFEGEIKVKFGQEKKPHKFNFQSWLALLEVLPLFLQPWEEPHASIHPPSGMICPAHLVSPTCAREGSCQIEDQCGDYENCCSVYQFSEPCCVSTESVPEQCSISREVCQRPDEYCNSNFQCYDNETCCQNEGFSEIGLAPCCVLSTDIPQYTEATPTPSPPSSGVGVCPEHTSQSSCQSNSVCQYDNQCFSTEICCIKNVLDTNAKACCVSNATKEATRLQTTSALPTSPEWTPTTTTASIIPWTPGVCPHHIYYDPPMCYICYHSGHQSTCLFTETCCLSKPKSRHCCYNSAYTSQSGEEVTNWQQFNNTTTEEWSTTASTTESTTASTTESTTASTTESTTESTPESTTASTTESTTASTTASTTEPTTASTTESTTAPTTESTTQSTTNPVTFPAVHDCVIPNGVSYIFWPYNNCSVNQDCPNVTECCQGSGGRGCYDWPTRAPQAGTQCPRGYNTCRVGRDGDTQKCNSADYRTMCQDYEYCCKIPGRVEACCVVKKTDLLWNGEPAP